MSVCAYRATATDPCPPCSCSKMPTANLKPVDRYGADQVQFGGSTENQRGGASGGGGGGRRFALGGTKWNKDESARVKNVILSKRMYEDRCGKRTKAGGKQETPLESMEQLDVLGNTLVHFLA